MVHRRRARGCGTDAVQPSARSTVRCVCRRHRSRLGGPLSERTPTTDRGGAMTLVLERRQVNADRKSTRLNSSHSQISYAVFCLKKKKTKPAHRTLPAH